MYLNRFQTNDETINRIQDQMIQNFKELSNNPFLGGQLLTNIQINTGDNTIFHSLNKRVTGWWLVDMDKPIQLFRVNDNKNTKNAIQFKSNKTGTISLYIF